MGAPRVEITNKDELLLRQVSPRVLTSEAEPSSSAFMPREVDGGLLSVDRGSKTSPEAAFALFTTPRPNGFGADSAGVWAVSVAELHQPMTAALRALEDPLGATIEAPANPAHALIDFTPYNKSQQKKIAQRLKALALVRGRMHP